VEKAGGAGLLHRYDYSLAEALRASFPEYDWDPAQFESEKLKRTSRSFWQDDNNLHSAFERAEKQLGISQV